ncbi:MAG: molybdenum cofactor biosynthesis protein MoaE [Gemmatimonadaceae bacterium]
MTSYLTDGVIDVARLTSTVSGPECGAVSLFLGTVRNENDGRAVTGIEYSAYREMAERELGKIVDEAVKRFGNVRVALLHRLGHLAVGEASVAIAVAHPHRTESLDAARFIIEALKQRVPIWKREHYVDGTREWVDPSRNYVEASP